MAYRKNKERLLGFDDITAFNKVLDANEQLKAMVYRLDRWMPEMTK